jgi:hypothetical protein
MLSSMSSCYHPVMMMCVFPEKRGHQYFSRGRRIRCNLSHGAIVQTRHMSRWILIERPDLIDRSFLKKKPAALPQFSPKSLPPSPGIVDAYLRLRSWGRGASRRQRACDQSGGLSLRVELKTSRLLNGCSNQLKYESNLFTLLQRPNMNTILQNITLDDYILILGSIHPGSG